MTTLTLTDAEEFFYAHAGWSYLPGVESPEHGRAKGAILLAGAEQRLERTEGAEIIWERDDFPVDCDCGDDHGPSYGAVLRKDGQVLASLWGITLNGSPPDDPYCRVVAAELALEAL